MTREELEQMASAYALVMKNNGPIYAGERRLNYVEAIVALAERYAEEQLAPIRRKVDEMNNSYNSAFYERWEELRELVKWATV